MLNLKFGRYVEENRGISHDIFDFLEARNGSCQWEKPENKRKKKNTKRVKKKNNYFLCYFIVIRKKYFLYCNYILG